jgi:catechol 2,3-dioxygenase-like lactoylglutathione lyase family enzyme
MFTAFSHVMMWTNDFDRALKWYTETLGCKVLFNAAPHYAALRLEEAGVNIALHPSETDGKDVGHGPMPYFKTDNIEETLNALAGKGIKIGEIQQEGPTKFASFWDSEGNALGVQQG